VFYIGNEMKDQKTLFAVKMDYAVAERVKSFCRERGVKYGFFVEKAVVEQMVREELKEDILDMKNFQDLELQAVSLEEYLKKHRG